MNHANIRKKLYIKLIQDKVSHPLHWQCLLSEEWQLVEETENKYGISYLWRFNDVYNVVPRNYVVSVDNLMINVIQRYNSTDIFYVKHKAA